MIGWNQKKLRKHLWDCLGGGKGGGRKNFELYLEAQRESIRFRISEGREFESHLELEYLSELSDA